AAPAVPPTTNALPQHIPACPRRHLKRRSGEAVAVPAPPGAPPPGLPSAPRTGLPADAAKEGADATFHGACNRWPHFVPGNLDPPCSSGALRPALQTGHQQLIIGAGQKAGPPAPERRNVAGAFCWGHSDTHPVTLQEGAADDDAKARASAYNPS